MLTILRQRNFALFWSGQMVFLFGDWVLFIGLPFYVYELTGSALATGGMFIAETIPRLLFGSVAGVFTDRWDRQKTLVAAHLLRAATLPLLLLFRSPEWLWIVYLAAASYSLISQFAVPASSALIPRLVDEKQLVSANSLAAMGQELTRLVGTAAGGALMATLGLTSVVLLNSASFLFAGLLINLISLPRGQHEVLSPSSGLAAATWQTVWSDLLDGLRLVKGLRTVTVVFVAVAIAQVGEGILNVALVPFVKNVLNVGVMELGWLWAAIGAGGVIGGFVVGHLGEKLPPNRLVALSGMAVGVIILVGMGFHEFTTFLLLVAPVGVPLTGFYIGVNILLQRSVGDQYRGRIFGTFNTMRALATLIGMGLASVFGDLVGVVPMMDLLAILYFSAGLAALAIWRTRSVLPVRVEQ